MNKLVIVQHKPTQFDAPYFSYATKAGAFDLHVFYTNADDQERDCVDPEIGETTVWDNLVPDSYSKTHLTVDQSAHPQTVCSLILREKPDHVILCGYSPMLYVAVAKLLRKQGVSIGLRADNTLRHSRFAGMKGVLKKVILPVWLRRYDSWHPVGTLAKEYLQTVGRASRPVFYFPYSVDNKWFAEESLKHSHRSAAIRQSFGFSSEDFVVLGIMKWTDREDPLTLVEAVKQAHLHNKRIKLALVGDGPLRSEVECAVAPIRQCVTTPGYLPYSQLPKYYAVADVFVHPAVGEPWGVSVNEAMACARPVIAAEGVGAGSDLIEHGKTGQTYPDGDIKALSEKILHMSRLSRNEVKAMGEAARQRVDSWGYERTMREMIGVLEMSTKRSHDTQNHS
jgi:glycosyltransferase involved in cell wall biosynthesis